MDRDCRGRRGISESSSIGHKTSREAIALAYNGNREMTTKKPEQILVVDDDQSLLDALRRSLRKNYPIQTACGGEEGCG